MGFDLSGADEGCAAKTVVKTTEKVDAKVSRIDSSRSFA
jgi:hypothetical protein